MKLKEFETKFKEMCDEVFDRCVCIAERFASVPESPADPSNSPEEYHICYMDNRKHVLNDAVSVLTGVRNLICGKPRSPDAPVAEMFGELFERGFVIVGIIADILAMLEEIQTALYPSVEEDVEPIEPPKTYEELCEHAFRLGKQCLDRASAILGYLNSEGEEEGAYGK